MGGKGTSKLNLVEWVSEWVSEWVARARYALCRNVIHTATVWSIHYTHTHALNCSTPHTMHHCITPLLLLSYCTTLLLRYSITALLYHCTTLLVHECTTTAPLFSTLLLQYSTPLLLHYSTSRVNEWVSGSPSRKTWRPRPRAPSPRSHPRRAEYAKYSHTHEDIHEKTEEKNKPNIRIRTQLHLNNTYNTLTHSHSHTRQIFAYEITLIQNNNNNPHSLTHLSLSLHASCGSEWAHSHHHRLTHEGELSGCAGHLGGSGAEGGDTGSGNSVHCYCTGSACFWVRKWLPIDSLTHSHSHIDTRTHTLLCFFMQRMH